MSHQYKHANKLNTYRHIICSHSFLQFCHSVSLDKMLFLVNVFFPFSFLLPLVNSLFPRAGEATGRSLSQAFCPFLICCSSPGQAQRLSPSLSLKPHLSVGEWGWQREAGGFTIAVDSTFLLSPHVFERHNLPQSCLSLIPPHQRLPAPMSHAVSSSSVLLWWCVSVTSSGLPLPVVPVSGVFSFLVFLQLPCLLQSLAGIRAMCLPKAVSLSCHYEDWRLLCEGVTGGIRYLDTLDISFLLPQPALSYGKWKWLTVNP